MMPVSTVSKMRRFSSIWNASLHPESTTDTSGWLHSQRNAHSRGERFTGNASYKAWTLSGACASLPPSNPSIITTGMPMDPASSSPFVPAWLLMSIKLYWIWTISQSLSLRMYSKSSYGPWKEKHLYRIFPAFFISSKNSGAPIALNFSQPSLLIPCIR